MAEIISIGLIELSSVATGFAVEDAMLKAAEVQILMARSICSGKFLIVIAGDVASVTAAVQAGAAVAGPSLIERRQIAHVDKSVLAGHLQRRRYRPQRAALHRRDRDLLRRQHHRGRRRVRQVGQRDAASGSPGDGSRRQGIRAHGRRRFQRSGSGCRRLQSCRRRRNAGWPRRDSRALHRSSSATTFKDSG